jgi:hypothetical protein
MKFNLHVINPASSALTANVDNTTIVLWFNFTAMTAPTRPAAAVMRPLRPAEQQWVFDPAMLERTPSRADGISLEEELERRKEAIVFMRSLWLRVAQ